MIIIYKKSTGKILDYVTSTKKVKQCLRQHIMPDIYELQGENRFPYPDDEERGREIFAPDYPRYNWKTAFDQIGVINIENRPLARLLRHNPTLQLCFDLSGNFSNIETASGVRWSLLELEKLDHSEPKE